MASSYKNVQHTYFSVFYKGRKLLLSISNVGNLRFAQANEVNSPINRPVFRANKSGGVRQGHARCTTGIFTKVERSAQATKRQRAVSRFQHGPTAYLLWGRTCKHGPAAATPCTGGSAQRRHQRTSRGRCRGSSFLQIQKSNVSWSSVTRWLQNYLYNISRENIWVYF